MPPTRIDAARFLAAEMAADGATLKLTLADRDGRIVVLALPLPCLGDLLANLPAPAEPPAGAVRDVHAWSLDAPPATRAGLTLKLQTPDGHVLAFRVTPGQIAGMATLATYGGLCAATARTIH
jgi:hypothetical protein